MKARNRDRQISIEKAIQTQAEGSGAVTTEWAALEQDWAEVRDLTGGEQTRLGQLVATTSRVFNIRYRTDISAVDTWSVRYEGRRYDLVDVREPDEAPRRSELDLYGTARADTAPGAP